MELKYLCVFVLPRLKVFLRENVYNRADSNFHTIRLFSGFRRHIMLLCIILRCFSIVCKMNFNWVFIFQYSRRCYCFNLSIIQYIFILFVKFLNYCTKLGPECQILCPISIEISFRTPTI